jgi:hypothetical protein
VTVRPVIHGRDHTFGATDPVFHAWEDVGGAGTGGTGAGQGTVNMVLDGRGTFLKPGVELDWESDYAAFIRGWKLMADTTGSISLDLRKDTFTAFPPTSGDSIVASSPPTLTSQDHNSDTVLSGWTTTVNAGDVVRLHVVSCSGITRIGLALKVTTT